MLEPFKLWISSYLDIIRIPFVFLPIIIGNIIILNIIFKKDLFKLSVISFINLCFFIIIASEVPQLSLQSIIPFQLNDVTHNIIRIILILVISIIISLINSSVIRDVSKNQFYILVLICLINVFILHILCDNIIVFFH